MMLEIIKYLEQVEIDFTKGIYTVGERFDLIQDISKAINKHNL